MSGAEGPGEAGGSARAPEEKVMPGERRKKRWFLRILLGLVLLLLAIVGIAAFTIDSLAGRALQRAIEQALGVPARVDGMSVSLLRGRIVASGLTIYDPPGFTNPYLMDSGMIQLDVDIGSLLTDTIRAHGLAIAGLTVNIEQSTAASNVGTVAEHLKKEKRKRPSEPGKKVALDRLLIEDIQVNLKVLPMYLPGGRTSVRVPRIELKNITSEEGVPLRQLVALLIEPVLQASVEQGLGATPQELRDQLRGKLRGLQQENEELRQKTRERLEEERRRLEEEHRGLKEKLRQP